MRVTAALLWLAFSTWVCYLTRPVAWPVLTVEPAQAHVGLMGAMFPESQMRQVQTLIDSGVPIASGKGFTIPQEGGIIHFRLARLPMRLQDFNFVGDGSGKPVIWIHSPEEEN